MAHTDQQEGLSGSLEGSEAAGERRLEFRGEEDSQLCDDASCDELVRGHVERRVPHLYTCKEQGEKSWLQCQTGFKD